MKKLTLSAQQLFETSFIIITLILSIFYFIFWIKNDNVKEKTLNAPKDTTFIRPNNIWDIPLPNDDLDSVIYIGEIITLKDLKSKSLYQVNCKFCHGESGKGDGIKSRLNPNICPHDLTTQTNTDKKIFYIILTGKNNMPSYDKKLEDDKIKLIIFHIKKFKK